MPEAAPNRAPDPFFTTRPIGKGSRLGRSMAHGGATQPGGTLRIEAAVGHGMIVSVCLPRARDGGEAGWSGFRETGGTPSPILVKPGHDEKATTGTADRSRKLHCL
ncbi:MAG: hypothetical protein P4L71_17590 [Acetobacteraceae bacterium]|nr:hypothetical protein [Acetobacteraceae bacterium]